MPINRRDLMKTAALVGSGMALGLGQARAQPLQQPVHWLIRGATVLTMDLRLGVLDNVDVEVRDGLVHAVGPNLDAPAADRIDARDMLLLPGLVDGHWHLWNSLARNYAPTAGRQPYFKAMAALAQRFTPELTELGVRLGLAEAANAGITTVNDWAHNLRSPAFADAELRALHASGLRGRFWYGYPQDLAADRAMNFEDLARRQASWAPGLIDLGMASRGPERTPEKIWLEEFTFARQQSLPISAHVSVTAQAQQQHAVRQLADRELLDTRVQLVHGTHLEDDDLALIRRFGASVCVTPLTEMRVGYGIPPILRLYRAGLTLSLGIDTLTLSGNANPFQVMQTLLDLASAEGNPMALTPMEVLYWMTQGGANAMGLGEKLGSITPGKRADLMLLDTRRLGLAPVTDAAAAVIQSATPRDVDTVLVEGRVIKRSGQLQAVDVAQLSADVRSAWRRLSP